LSSVAQRARRRRAVTRTSALGTAVALVLPNPATRAESAASSERSAPGANAPSRRAEEAELLRVQERTLSLYAAIVVLMLLGIAVLAAYAIRIGPLTSPGAQASFGYALALMSLMAAVVFHVVDRTYRVWPFGRHFRPSPPGPITVQAQVRFLQVLTVVLAAAAIAYVIGGLLA
jgi:hypothetical protein